MQRIGIGYDIHRLVKGRKLILGGVHVPFELGLEGHSDADVLIHALCDAVLGALGLGDIGEHFPDTDTKYKDISSKVLLKKIENLLQEHEYEIENIDCIIQAEQPKLKEYKMKMKENISAALNVEVKKINIKAKTNEKIGPIGESKAMAAFATILLTNE